MTVVTAKAPSDRHGQCRGYNPNQCQIRCVSFRIHISFFRTPHQLPDGDAPIVLVVGGPAAATIGAGLAYEFFTRPSRSRILKYQIRLESTMVVPYFPGNASRESCRTVAVARLHRKASLEGVSVASRTNSRSLRYNWCGIVLEGRNRKTLYETSIATVVRKDSTGERNTFLTSVF